jgi:hypothetical protein
MSARESFVSEPAPTTIGIGDASSEIGGSEQLVRDVAKLPIAMNRRRLPIAILVPSLYLGFDDKMHDFITHGEYNLDHQGNQRPAQVGNIEE